MADVSHCEFLADDDLDRITGGAISCGNALTLSKGYLAAATVCAAFGDIVTSSILIGRSSGVLDAACGA